MDEVIKSLKASPIFNLSLSSKELFHSNFIAWLCQIFPSEMGGIFARILRLAGEYIIDIKTVRREEKNIDLTFDILLNGKEEESTITIVVENKVKSLPYKDQLTKYSSKFKDDKKTYMYVLLSLSEPKNLLLTGSYIFDENNIKWNFIRYSEFAKEIADINVENYIEKHNIDYYKSILTDYCVFINDLTHIDSLADCKLDEKLDFYENNSDYMTLKNSNIRLHSFFIKRKFESFANILFLILKKEYTDIEIFRNNDSNYKEDSILINNGINFSKGVVAVYYKINETTQLAIELDGYRYYKAIGGSIKDIEQLTKKVYELKWFDYSHISEEKGSMSKTYEQYFEKGLNGYRYPDREHLYIPINLTKENTIQDICNYFIFDLKLAMQIKKDILF